MVRPQRASLASPSPSSSRKRKDYQPQQRVQELVPEGSPWSASDWWNEKSGTCRPIVEKIRESLEAATEVFVFDEEPPDNTTEAAKSKVDKVPLANSPTSVLDPTPDKSDERVIHFDRGYVRYLEEEGHAKGVWGVFHLNWGKLLSSRPTGSPWRVKTAGDSESKIDPKLLKYAIRKPTGLWQDELSSCIAMLRHENEGDSPLPLKAVAEHLKIADFQYFLMKARNQVQSRKSAKLNSLRVDGSNGKPVELWPILQVIVDDTLGEVFVEDALEILDAMIGFASSFQCTMTEHMGWTMEHETCGDLAQLFDGWEESNKKTTEAFVLVCLQELIPQGQQSERTAMRDSPRRNTRKKTIGKLPMIG